MLVLLLSVGAVLCSFLPFAHSSIGGDTQHPSALLHFDEGNILKGFRAASTHRHNPSNLRLRNFALGFSDKQKVQNSKLRSISKVFGQRKHRRLVNCSKLKCLIGANHRNGAHKKSSTYNTTSSNDSSQIPEKILKISERAAGNFLVPAVVGRRMNPEPTELKLRVSPETSENESIAVKVGDTVVFSHLNPENISSTLPIKPNNLSQKDSPNSVGHLKLIARLTSIDIKNKTTSEKEFNDLESNSSDKTGVPHLTTARGTVMALPLDELKSKNNFRNHSYAKPNMKNKPIRHELKIKRINNTYALVREKIYIKVPALKDGKRGSEASSHFHEEKRASGDDIKQDYVNPTNSSRDADAVVNSKSNSEVERLKTESLNRESKRIPLFKKNQQLFNESNSKFLLDLPLNPLVDSFKEEKSTGDSSVQKESPLHPYEKKDSSAENVDLVADLLTTTTDSKTLLTNLGHRNETNSTTDKKISAVETREVDTETFFSLVEPELNLKKVKKVPNEATNSKSNSPEDGIYHLDVITSSSEVSYKQFELLSNATQFDSTFKAVMQSNGTKRESTDSGSIPLSNKTLFKPNSNSSITNSSKIKNRTFTNSETTNVTSLPSQTSVVEPIRTNSSSIVAQVTLPGTKTGGVLPPEKPFPQDPDAVRDPFPLEEYPEQRMPLKEGSQSPPFQQELSSSMDQSVSSGVVVGIVLGVLISMAIVGGVTAYFVYRRLEGFRPKILSADRSCANSDSGGYLDDQCRVAYVNSQIDVPKSTPEDLVSLDNDSFLNSLESMTIQNLWTDNIRHTKL